MMEGLAKRVVQLEGTSTKKTDNEDEDDFELFGSDDEDEEEIVEEKAEKEELLKKYHEKKSKTPLPKGREKNDKKKYGPVSLQEII